MIFRDNAPRHWAANLPVIPTIPETKRPAISGWQEFCQRMPTAEEMDQWLWAYRDCNVGLPFGPASGMVAVDVDTTDEKILEVLQQILPDTPYVRVGKKGYAAFYRYEPWMRSFPIQGILDFLAAGRQAVIPPSIHMETGRPYVANCELVDVVSILPMLPRDFESRIRAALNLPPGGATRKFATFVARGARDNDMVGLAGSYSRAICKGERTFLEAHDAMIAWVKNFAEQVEGDALDPQKAVETLIKWLVKDVTVNKQTLPPGWDAELTAEQKAELGLEELSSSERWDLARILDYIKQQFGLHTDPYSAGRSAAIDMALSKMVENQDLNKIAQDQIASFIVKHSDATIKKTAISWLVLVIQKPDVIGNDHTELSKALIERYLEPFGQICFDADEVHQWNGAYWKVVDPVKILKLIQDNFGHLPAAKKLPDHKSVKDCLRVQLSERKLPVYDKPIINFANGALTDELELVPHNPEHGLTYVMPYRYMPALADQCPRFFGMQHRAWGKDQDFQQKVDLLQEYMAATMFGVATRFQKAICLKGNAGSGKTAFARIVQGLMIDDTISHVKPEHFGTLHYPARMFGKLMNFCGEVPKKKLIPGESFKTIVEGSEVEDRILYGQLFKFKPKCAQWFCGNPLPKSDDTSEGFSRRWLFLEFSDKIRDDEKVDNYEETVLTEEREAIVAWAVQGILRLKMNKKFTEPPSHDRLVSDMRQYINSVYDFLFSKRGHDLRFGTGRVYQHELYQAYEYFCADRRIPDRMVEKESDFRESMKDLRSAFGFDVVDQVTIQGATRTVYEGITLIKGGVQQQRPVLVAAE